jgi:hypothetical protein
VRQSARAVVVLAISAAVVAGAATLRLRGDASSAPHDPVTLDLHRPAHAATAHRTARRAVAAHRPSVRPRPSHPAARPIPTSKPTPRPKPASRPAPATPPAAKPTPQPRPKPASKPVPAAPAPVSLPTFTWTPLATATGYEFQLFRGSELVFRARTPKPSIALPPAWTFKGRLVRVTPGTYRWYVWPLAGEKRQDTAVVQAKLTVR